VEGLLALDQRARRHAQKLMKSIAS
jgi:hypothetical protein